jgi:hypothetical protein
MIACIVAADLAPRDAIAAVTVVRPDRKGAAA